MMKTNKLSTILATIVLMCSACGADDAIETINPTDEQQQQPTHNVIENAVSFSGTIAEQLYNESAEEATRLSIDGTQVIAWEEGDKLSISDGTLNYTYVVETASAGQSCSFQPKDGTKGFSADDAEQEATFNAFYPASAVLSWNNDVLSTMIYTEQKYDENKPGSDDDKAFGPYMVSRTTTTENGSKASFSFRPIASVIDVDLTDLPIANNLKVVSVSIYANNKVSIAGKLRYNTTTGAISVLNNDATDYSYSTQSETVTVGGINKTLAELETESEGVVRFFVLPVKIVGGVVVTVRLSDGTYYSKHTNTNVGTGSVDTENNNITLTGVTDGAVCKPYYKKYNSSNFSLTNNWMATIPGNVKFNFLSIPGAHDAATSSCSSSVAKCQQYDIAELLQKGCRALDLRPYYNSSSLEIYHGSVGTDVTLANALDAVTGFLDSNPTETVFILIAQEGGSDGNTDWQNRVWSCLNNYTSHIASYGWQGNLNPCRGKMVIIFRNTYTGGANNGDLGCGKVGWGSSFNDKTILTGNGSTTGKGTLRYQDEYETSSTSTKLANMTTMLNDHIVPNEKNATYTFVNNVNIAGFLSNISSLSTSMNTALLGSSTFTNHTGRFGIMMADFLHSSSQKGDEVYNLIRNQNYKYVYKGRTRCGTSSGTGTGVIISNDEYADNSQVYSKRSF